MHPIPLLPKPTGQEWPHQDSLGIHSITDKDYQLNLCENYYQASDFGTPSPLAQAIIFAQRLERYTEDVQNNVESDFGDTFDVWSLFMKAFYFGLITLRSINLHDLREIGEIVTSELPEEFDFHFLYFKEKVIGFTYLEVGFVPSVRLEQDVIHELTRAVERKEVEKASEYFVGWVHTFDNKVHDNILFYTLLYQLAAEWNPDAPKTLSLDFDQLFDPGPKFWLTANKAEEEIARPMVPLYIGTPIICDKCGHQIGREGALEIRQPDDCRCPECGAKQNWLDRYNDWIKFSEKRGRYLIFAFNDSPVRKPPLSNVIVYEDDGIVIKTGKIIVKVFGLIFSEELLKCSRLLFFKDGERERRPDLPVRGEYFGSVKVAERQRNPRLDRATGDYIISLDVEEWDELVTIRYNKNEIEYEEAFLLSWPNFRLKDWNVYYYLLETRAHMYKAGIRLRALTTGDEPHLLEDTRGQLPQAFDAFEIVFSKNGKIENQSGIFNVTRNEIIRGESPLSIAIDYGTSASSMTYKLGDGPVEMLRFVDFTDEVIPNKIISDEVLSYSYWLPTYRIDDAPTAVKFYRDQLESEDHIPVDGEKIVRNLNYYIPSELICEQPVSAEKLEKPLSGFRICHVYATRPEDSNVIYEVKLTDSKGDEQGRYSYDNVVFHYLEMFLILSLATIVNKEQRAGYLIVKASFPRNFDDDKIRLYLGCLDKVLKKIETLTGFVTNATYYIDESRAAAYSMPVQGGMALVMDMGGGTTDIGVFEREKGKLKPIFIESLMYGANAYLRMLAGKGELFPKPSEKFDNRLLWLFREIRLRNFDTVVKSQYRGNKQSREVALELLLRFYKPIAHFVRLLFEALSIHRGEDKNYKQEAITFYLAGNGWSLADAIQPIDKGYNAGYRDVVRYLLEMEGFTDLTAASEPVFDDELAVWPGPKAAIGFGTMKAPQKNLYRSIEEACNGENGIRSIIGFDIKYSDGSDNFKPAEWHREVPHRVDTVDWLPVVSDIKLPTEWGFIEFEKGKEATALAERCKNDITGVEKPVMSRSVMSRFIEEVYRAQLDRDRRI